jgi:hypothetical protein
MGCVDAELEFVPSGAQPPAGTWWLSILDDSDQANALGYHDLTTDGLPIGKVFAGTDLKVGASWSVTASHELLEMLADPNINLTVFVQNADTTGRLYAYERATPASPTTSATRWITSCSRTSSFRPGLRAFVLTAQLSSIRPDTSKAPCNCFPEGTLVFLT